MFLDHYELSNGITLVVCRKETDLAHGRFLFRVGSFNEDDSTRGVSHLIEHLLFNCCSEMTSLEFNSKMDELGAIINASTSNEFTRYYFSSLKENFFDAMELYKKLFLSFKVTDTALSKEVDVVCQEIGSYKDDVWDLTYQLLYENIFKSHPIKHPILGYEEVLKSLSTEDVQNYYDANYVPASLTFLACGNFDENDITRLKDSLEQLKGGETRERLEIKPGQRKPILKKAVSYKEDLNQTLLISCIPVTGMENLTKLEVLSTILGGSMSSFLWNEFREKRSIAYRIGSFPGYIDKDTPLLYFYTAVNNKDDADLSISLFKEAVEYASKITEKEFEKSKVFNRTAKSLGRERVKGIIDALEEDIVLERPTIDFEHRDKELAELTYSDFIDFTRNLDPESILTAILFPKE